MTKHLQLLVNLTFGLVLLCSFIFFVGRYLGPQPYRFESFLSMEEMLKAREASGKGWLPAWLPSSAVQIELIMINELDIIDGRFRDKEFDPTLQSLGSRLACRTATDHEPSRPSGGPWFWGDEVKELQSRLKTAVKDGSISELICKNGQVYLLIDRASGWVYFKSPASWNVS